MLRFIRLNPILLSLFSHLSFPLVMNNAPHSIYFLSPLTLFARSRVRHRARLHSPRGSFRSIFSYFYRSAYTTSINHHSCTPFSYIFTSDYNFESFVSSLPGGLPFLPVRLFFFQSLTLYLYSPAISLSLFYSHLLDVYRFNYSFN